jgi:drug/metabolite transporter (DMT)-like permease
MDRTAVLFALTAALGGVNVVAVHFSNQELDPFWGAATRFYAAAWLFLIYAVANRTRMPRGRALTGAILYGLLGYGLSYAFIYWAVLRVPPGTTQLLLALTPLLTILLARAQHAEPWRWRTVAGSLLALIGIALVFREQIDFRVPWTSLLAVLLGAAAIAQAHVVGKRFPPVPPAAMNVVGLTTGASLLLLLSFLAGNSHTLPAGRATWIAWGYLVTVGSFGLFFLYILVLHKWSASATSYLFLLFPLVAILASNRLTGEPITLGFIGGGMLVLVGVYVGALHHGRPPPAPEPAST